MISRKRFQGDILLPPPNPKANDDRIRFFTWSNNTIPYELNARHSKEQNFMILNAFETIESVTCIRFVHRTNQKDYIFITVVVNVHHCLFCNNLIVIFSIFIKRITATVAILTLVALEVLKLSIWVKTVSMNQLFFMN